MDYDETAEVTSAEVSHTDPNGTKVSIQIDMDVINGFYLADLAGGHAWAAAEAILDLVAPALAAVGFDAKTAVDAAEESILTRADAIKATTQREMA